jgi:transcriptional antiterminator RfaH
VACWTVAQLQPQRDRLALHCLGLAGFETYQPRLREVRRSALFPGYAFVVIELQWHAARWCPGVVRLVMDGLQPAKVPDAVIEEVRGRERNGAVELPKRALRRGDRVKILAGPFCGHLAIFADISAHERVAVLLRGIQAPAVAWCAAFHSGA